MLACEFVPLEVISYEPLPELAESLKPEVLVLLDDMVMVWWLSDVFKQRATILQLLALSQSLLSGLWTTKRSEVER